MKRSFPILRGRGTPDNLPNRFERLHVELDPEERGAPHGPTQYFRDTSRTVLTRNHSPDVGFDWSVNPYRGCQHGCVYCLAPDTPILDADLSWHPLGEVQVGDQLLGFDEHPKAGRNRKLRPAVVEAVWWSRKPTVRIVTERTEVVTTAEHLWLTAGSRWRKAGRLLPGVRLRHLSLPREEVEKDEDYRAGYLSGISLGDATFRFEPNWRSDKLGYPAAYWRLVLADDEPLHRVAAYLRQFRVDASVRPFAPATGSRRGLQKIEIRSLGRLARIHALLNHERPTRSYRRGFLAGFFDAEGHDGKSLRTSQKDRRVLERVNRYDPDPILAVEAGPVADVVDIQTSTRTFFAAGLATHNCYARPTHEYLGLSAGFDFESKIFVKEEAPELLERRIARPAWKPTVLVMSGVTDPYQPVERRLEITRRCLGVLAEARHPVAIITKSRLVERDIDLLARLAEVGAVHVTLSITTLDRGIQRALEPRASPPEHRLEAIRSLASAGIPVAVNVAPVIPGLTEHEIPAIVDAAAQAGATGAGYVVLRLPGAVAPLFLSWLKDHAPDRVGKVTSRLRSLRGGGLYDATFGRRMRGEGPFAEQIASLFDLSCARAGLRRRTLALSGEHFRRPRPKGSAESPQLDLF